MKQKILVVDDEKDILESLQELLSEEGFEVILAGTVGEFRKKALKSKPDLIILDIMLGQDNALDAYQELLTVGLDSKIPVLFLTGLLQDRPPSPARPGRSYALMGKPFHYEELMKEIRCLVSV